MTHQRWVFLVLISYVSYELSYKFIFSLLSIYLYNPFMSHIISSQQRQDAGGVRGLLPHGFLAANGFTKKGDNIVERLLYMCHTAGCTICPPD